MHKLPSASTECLEASLHLKRQCSTVQGVKSGVVAVLWLSIGGHGVNFEEKFQLLDKFEHDCIRMR